MEYFKRVQTSELDGLGWIEKQEVSEKVVEIAKKEVNEIMKINSLARKLEVFIRYLSVGSLSDLAGSIKVVDVHNKNITYVLEAMLKRIEEQKKLADNFKKMIEKVSALVQKNIMKSLKSKGTNHIIRVLLRIGHSTDQLKVHIKNVPIEHFLEDSTRSATYVEYINYVPKEERERIVEYMVKSISIDRLTSYTAFLYEKACTIASLSQLQEIFKVIKPELLSLCKDSIGNYFMQAFIRVYPPEEIYAVLEPHIHTFQRNSNVLRALVTRACEEKRANIIESVIERVFEKDTLMHTLLFHEAGGFDTKSYKLALKILSVRTAYQESLQMQCVALYEKHWLFCKVGQEALICLLETDLDKEIVNLLLRTMTKEFIAIRQAKGGDALLNAIEKVADRETRRKISIVRQQESKYVDKRQKSAV